jgi:hypothetical protein
MNDELALIVEAHPKQFLGFAAVPLQDVRAACGWSEHGPLWPALANGDVARIVGLRAVFSGNVREGPLNS